MKKNKYLPIGHLMLYRTMHEKGGILNTGGKFLTQIVYNRILITIPVDNGTKIDNLQPKVSKYIKLPPNNFIMAGISEQNGIFLINVNDKLLEPVKKGVNYFQVYEHNYDVNFLMYDKFKVALKEFSLYNRVDKFLTFFPEQNSFKFMKQLIFDRVHHVMTKILVLNLK
jgi:hypothetical protein